MPQGFSRSLPLTRSGKAAVSAFTLALKGHAVQRVKDADRHLAQAGRTDSILVRRFRVALNQAKLALSLDELSPAQARMVIDRLHELTALQLEPLDARFHLDDLVQKGVFTRHVVAVLLGLESDRSARRLAKRRRPPALAPATMKLIRRNWPVLRRISAIANSPT